MRANLPSKPKQIKGKFARHNDTRKQATHGKAQTAGKDSVKAMHFGRHSHENKKRPSDRDAFPRLKCREPRAGVPQHSRDACA